MDFKAAKAILKELNTVGKVKAIYKTDPEKYAQYRKALNVFENSTEAERAVKQGFDVNETLYHGSPAKNIDHDLSGFKESKGGGGKAKYGEGVYLTNSKNYATQFADHGDGRVYDIVSKNNNKPFSPSDEETALEILKKYGIEEPKTIRLKRGSEAGLQLLEKNLPKEEITKAIDKAGYKLHEDFGMPGTLADIRVDRPENVRMTQAAFDPRFEKSKWIMAGAGAMPMADISPLEPLKKVSQFYDEQKKKYIDPITEKGLDLMNLSKDKSAMNVPKEIGKMVVDPLNVVEGPVGAAINAVKFGVDMIPSKEKASMITPETAQQLLDKKIISADTHQKLQNYFNGGKVKNYADGGSVSQVPPQDPSQANVLSSILQPTTVSASPQMSVSPELQRQIEEAKVNTNVQAQVPVQQEQVQAPQEVAPQEQDLRWNAQMGKWIPKAEASVAGQQAFQEQEGVGGIKGLQKTSDGGMQIQQAPQDPYSAKMGMLPGLASGYDQAFGQMQQGIEKSAIAGANAAAGATAAITRATNDLQEWQNKQQQVEVDRQARLEDKRQTIEQMTNNYLSKATVDPNRFWADKSTGQKVMAAIGVALGGVGRLGGPNQALDYINNAISRDIDAQKFNAESQKGGVLLQNNIYKDMMDQFQDSRAAATATRLSMINIAELNLKKYAEQNQGLQVQANAQKMMGELNLKKTELQQNLMMQYRFSPMAMAADDMARKVAMLPPDLQKEALKERGEYQKHSRVVDGVVEAMDDIYKNRVSGLQGYSQKKAAITKIKSLTSEIFGGKSESEFEIIEGLLPSVTDSKETYNKKVGSIVQKLNSQASFPTLESYGLLPKEFKMRSH